MTKAHALRKRYLLFEVKGSQPIEDELKRGIYSESLRFFGEYGSSFIQLKLVEYDVATKTGILRCNRDKIEEVLGFLALVNELNGKKARLITKRTSGTINKLNEKNKTDEDITDSKS